MNPPVPTRPASSGRNPPGGESLPEMVCCWKSHGVYGDGTCPDLPHYVHCRHCPAYSQAALQLLNRPLPADYREEWTRHFARQKPLLEPGNTSALLFRLEREWFGLPTDLFQEVAERRAIHSLPHRRNGVVLGLTNVRGELVICVSLGPLVGVAQAKTLAQLRQSYGRLLVANWHGHRFAFPVDEVHGACRFHLQQLQPRPAPAGGRGPVFLRGLLPWQGRTAALLDADTVFSTLNQRLT